MALVNYLLSICPLGQHGLAYAIKLQISNIVMRGKYTHALETGFHVRDSAVTQVSAAVNDWQM